MVRKTVANMGVGVLALIILIPAAAFAQSAGIAGVVRDSSGLALPGVTVEAASPALIEKVRTVVTNNQGQYRFIDLRPGVYSVTFTLTGFSTVVRDGIELSVNFTAPVNADLRVGALEETITVSGASPVVDVQSVIQQKVVTAAAVTALPSSRTAEQLAALIPGMVIGQAAQPTGQDVGGTASEGQQKLGIHGGRTSEMLVMIDSMPVNALQSPASSGIYMDTGAVQEIGYEVGAHSSEAQSGGVRVNMIPKTGGNRFTGSLFGAYTNGSLQSNNFSDDLRNRGLGAINTLRKIWDVNLSIGGPIKQDKLWFFSSFRHWGTHESVAGIWYDMDPKDNVYTPDLNRQGLFDSNLIFGSGRFTWQATSRNKFNVIILKEDRCVCHRLISSTTAPEAARRMTNPEDQLVQVSWSAPITNRLLLEAGVMPYRFAYTFYPQEGVTPDMLAITELSTNLNFRANSGAAERYLLNNNWIHNYRAALAYVTGAHAFKVGMNLQQGRRDVHQWINGDMSLQVLNGVPRSVSVFTTPYNQQEKLNANLGLFAQDQWTLKRLTLNMGIRFDYFNSSVPEQRVEATRFVGPRHFAEVKNVPNWKDLSPRLGVAYDLFGNGKTALKATVSRYVAGETVLFATANNPLVTSVNTANRTWTDNGDFIPQENELGPLSNSSFGQVVVRTFYDDDVREGFGKRGSQLEMTAGVQQEVMPRVSASATYTRRAYGNLLATDNVLVNPEDYDEFCVTAPVDPRLPGGGGNQICGLYDINPSKFGQVNNLVTFAKNFGETYEYWHGMDLIVDARLPRGMLVAGGVSIGRTVFDQCDVIGKVDNPAVNGENYQAAASPTERFCHQDQPFQPHVKINAVMPLPWALQLSGTYQGLPGPQITARWVAPNSVIRPSLGRDLAAGANGTAVVELIEPGTMYGERLHQVDVRVSKIVRIGRTRFQGNFDVYNALNGNPVLIVNNTFGPAWQRPGYVLPGRLLKFGVQVDF